MAEMHHARVWSDMTDPGICRNAYNSQMPTTRAVALAHGFKPNVLGKGGDGGQPSHLHPAESYDSTATKRSDQFILLHIVDRLLAIAQQTPYTQKASMALTFELVLQVCSPTLSSTRQPQCSRPAQSHRGTRHTTHMNVRGHVIHQTHLQPAADFH
jgi:hypothetical protein